MLCEACGLSNAKLRTIRELATRIVDRRLDLKRLNELDDAGIAEMLLPIPGIGPWSVQMVLIFGLCRMDVLPVGDLGFRQGVRDFSAGTTKPGRMNSKRSRKCGGRIEPWQRGTSGAAGG